MFVRKSNRKPKKPKKPKTKKQKKPLIPALGSRGRQISEFEESLVYKVSSWTARAIQRNAVSKNQNNNKTKTNKQKHFLRFIVAFINMLYPKIKHYNLSCSLSQQLNSSLYQIFCSILLPQFNLCHP